MKLSEFDGQEHITAPLRAMVINHDPSSHIAIVGDDSIARHIFNAFDRSLNCERPIKGDHCGKCDSCQFYLRSKYALDLAPKFTFNAFGAKPLYIAFEDTDGYLTFHVKKTPTFLFNKNLVELLIVSNFTDKKPLIELVQEISKEYNYDRFLTEYLSLFRTILHIRLNVEVEAEATSEALRQLAVKLPPTTLMACMKVLWDAQTRSVLPDTLGIEMVSTLVSGLLAPMPAEQEVTDGLGLPINQVEKPFEQPLSFERIREIARE